MHPHRLSTLGFSYFCQSIFSSVFLVARSQNQCLDPTLKGRAQNELFTSVPGLQSLNKSLSKQAIASSEFKTQWSFDTVKRAVIYQGLLTWIRQATFGKIRVQWLLKYTQCDRQNPDQIAHFLCATSVGMKERKKASKISQNTSVQPITTRHF